MKKWVLIILLFSVAVNLAVVGTLIYFWKVSDHKNSDLIWLSDEVETGDFNKFVIVKKDSFITTKNIDQINAKRLDWGNKMSDLNQSIAKDRRDIIGYLLVNPPQRDSINVVIHRLGSKQIKAESLTVDHLIGIRELLPTQEWEDLVNSVGKGCQIIVQKKVIKNGQNENVCIEIKEFDEDIEIKTFEKK